MIRNSPRYEEFQTSLLDFLFSTTMVNFSFIQQYSILHNDVQYPTYHLETPKISIPPNELSQRVHEIIESVSKVYKPYKVDMNKVLLSQQKQLGALCPHLAQNQTICLWQCLDR